MCILIKSFSSSSNTASDTFKNFFVQQQYSDIVLVSDLDFVGNADQNFTMLR